MKYFILLTILFPIIMGGLLYMKKYDDKADNKRNTFSAIAVILTSVLVFALMLFSSKETLNLVSLLPNMPIAFRVDGLSYVFLTLIAILWPLAVFYAFEYMGHEKNKSRFFMFYIMTYGVVIGLATSANLITFYLMYECLTFITLPLVTHSMDRRSVHAGRLYFKYSIFGASLAFVGIMILMQYSSSLDFVYGGVLELTKVSGNELLVIVGYLLTFFGFGVKAAIFPFHGWLPTAGVAPTPVTALLHAVAVVKAGVFAIMRVTFYSFGTSFLAGTWAQDVVLAFACFTVVFGSAMALKQQHLKKRFAYSTISNLSYIVLGIGMMSTAGLAGALAHMFFHGIMKICLFFVVGVVMEKTHKEFVSQIEGFGLKMPVTFICLTIGACALSGIPLFAGFVSKFALANASVQLSNIWSVIIVLCLLLSAVLTSAYTFELSIKAFITHKEFDYQLLEGVKDPSWLMKGPLVILCVLMIVFGVVATPLMDAFVAIASNLL